jgi:hypothetical protein
VEEKSDQLKAISNLAALFCGFATVTLTQFIVQPDYSWVSLSQFPFLLYSFSFSIYESFLEVDFRRALRTAGSILTDNWLLCNQVLLGIYGVLTALVVSLHFFLYLQGMSVCSQGVSGEKLIVIYGH